MIHVLQGIQSLTQDELETRILNVDIDQYLENDLLLPPEIELFFDLSQVRWVNIGAACQLCLLIEKAKKNGIKVYLALPYRNITDAGLISKRADQSTLKGTATKRAKANDFLRVINFDGAALCEHITQGPDVYLSEDFQFSQGDLDLKYFYEVFSQENDSYTPLSSYYDFKYNYIFPITWISETPENYDELSAQIENLLGDDERGIHHLDILSLKNVILSELIKNVRQHAGSNTKHALFCMGLFKTSSIQLAKNEDETIVHSNDIENSYLAELINSNIQSNIEIFFGDSGYGLCSSKLLEQYNKSYSNTQSIANVENELIKWSFNKWSTSKSDEDIRGTKGLYRIHRIVNKYNGIIHIRTKHSNAGYQKGGKDTSTFVKSTKNKKYNHPGTFVQIKLCPNKEVLKFNIRTSQEGGSSKKKWRTYTYEINEHSIDSSVFSGKFKEILLNDFDNIILVLTKDNLFHFDEESLVKLGELFIKVSDLRHPKGVIIYNALSIGKEALDGIIDSANSMIFERNQSVIHPESLNPNFEEVYDPVLVLGEQGLINWYGGNKIVNEILLEIFSNYGSEGEIKLSSLESYSALGDDDRHDILKNFQNDDSLFKIKENEDIILNFTGVIDIYRKELTELIAQDPNHTNICSPKLDIAEKWIDFKKILSIENSAGFALALYSILLDQKKELLSSKITTIFIDHSQQYKLAEELARLIGLPPNKIVNLSEDIDVNLPRRTKLFNEVDKVLILTTIISSSETARRLVKQVLRDKATPISVITLLNINKESINSIRTWKNFTDVYSLNKPREKSNSEIKLEYDDKFKIVTDKLYINLNSSAEINVYSPTYEIEKESDKGFKLPQDLSDLFDRTKSLHYDHFGKYNDRHYTFFLNKKNILRDGEIKDSLKEEIFKWTQVNNIDQFTFIVPDKNFDTLKKVISGFGFNQVEVLLLKEVNNENYYTPENAVFFDFGTITGSTVDTILNSNPCSKNLLIITVFSQLKEEKTKLYNKISRVRSEYTSNEKDDKQYSLFVPVDDPQKTIESTIDVTFKNLFELPIFFYHSIHCPICQHSEALEFYKLKKSEYLKSFANDRKDRLKIKSQQNIPKVPIDSYGTAKNYAEHIMSSKLVFNIYEFKRLLELSIEYTSFRIKLYKKLYSINADKKENLKDEGSYLYAFIYLLSHEIIWFQKEPLILRNFRYLAYSISKYVAEFDINELAAMLSNDNKKLGFNLATRYKYAAITVFRSANKFKFTQSIFNIIQSSVVNTTEPYVGNNIFQNTFYHINSIHINQHNNSEKFYKNIESELSKLLESDIPLANTIEREQLNTIKLVRYNNSRNQQIITLNELNQVEIFKKLKNTIQDIYHKKGNHPWPSDFFLSITIDEETLLNNIIDKREDGKAYNYFLKFQKDLKSNYDKLSNFINIFIIPFFEVIESKKNNFLYSYSYNRLRSSYITYVKKLSSFETMIDIGSKNILDLIDHHEEYIEFCELINETFIPNEDPNKTELFKLIDAVPANICEEVNHVFQDAGFKSYTINVEDNLEGFICKTVLKRELKHILKNIEKRQNHNYDSATENSKPNINRDLSNCSIAIKATLENENIVLVLEYDNTEKFNKTLNSNGNLNDLKNELLKWDGSADWGLNQAQGLFRITLTMTHYGK